MREGLTVAQVYAEISSASIREAVNSTDHG